MWDLTTTQHRSYGLISADTAGFSVFEALRVATTTTQSAVTAAANNPTPTWTEVALPSQLAAGGSKTFAGTDGYLYVFSTGGAKSIFRTPDAHPGVFTDITGKGLPSSESNGLMFMMPNGTLLISQRAKGIADLYYWNGSTTNPAWKKVGGWNGVSPSSIYTMTNDSAGYSYFSPNWSGDIWRNSAPGSTSFSKVVSNFYSITKGGGIGHPTSGGIYAFQIYDLHDGKGDMAWICGEGELDNINLKFSASSNTAYLTTEQGFKSNCTSMGKSPTSILVLRTKLRPDGYMDFLNRIDIATRKVTTIFSPAERTETSFPYALNTNVVNSLHWMTGNTWLLSSMDTYNNHYLVLSADDGETWTDITPGLSSSCTGEHLTIGAATTSHYIFEPCSGGTSLAVYGPVN